MTMILILLSFSAIFAIITSQTSVLIGTSLFVMYLLLLIFHKKIEWRIIVLICGTFFMYLNLSMNEVKGWTSNYDGTEQNFTIQLTNNFKIDGSQLRVEVKTKYKREKLLLKHNFKTAQSKQHFIKNFTPPTKCQVVGKLEAPAKARNENAFDYWDYLRQRNINWILNVNNLSVNNCQNSPETIMTSILKIREAGVQHISENFSSSAAPIIAALIFGERDLMPDSLTENYQRLGITHLLAISGLHVGLITGLIYYVCLRSGLRKELIMKIMLIFLPFYIILTGAAPSVIRAATMIWLIIVTQLMSKVTIRAIDTICITFLLFLFIKPHYLYHPGFQLSFLVSFVLIVSSAKIITISKSRILQLFTISLIAQVAAIPILLYHFYEISLISVIMNLLYVPLFSVIILPLTIITFLIHLIAPFIATPFVFLLEHIIKYANDFAATFASFRFATIIVGRPNGFLLICYFIGIGIFFYNLERATTLLKKITSLTVLITIILVQIIYNQYSPFGEVTFIDVGQGDSILIKLPFHGGTYLIDTGGVVNYDQEEWRKRTKQFEPGRDIVAPFLKSKGITRINKLIISHSHLDHAGGAFHLIENFKIDELIVPIVAEENELLKELLLSANMNKLMIKKVDHSFNWHSGKALFSVLSPRKADLQYFNENDNSIVIIAQIGQLKWLFTGDLEAKGEQILIRNYPQLKVDVLKVGHHGSKTSTTEQFLDVVKPKIAVISCGVNNSFGHPHPDVLRRLEGQNIKILRTDKVGAVSYKFIFNGRGTFLKQIP